jgi:hypothetical protein
MKVESRTQEINLAEQAEDIERVLQRAVNHALLMHKRLGNPIATWEDGRVVIIPPEEIVISSGLPEDEAPKD